MQIKINIQVQDWLAFQRHIERAANEKNTDGGSRFWSNFFIWMVTSITLTIALQTVDAFHWPSAIVVVLIFVIFISLHFINLRSIRNTLKPSKDGIFCGEHEFNFDDNGFHAQGEGYHSHYQWLIVKKTERVNGLVLIYLDAFQAIVIPERDLENPDELYQFICQKVSK
ncbi:MAG: YcxB family protein [Psychrosphaera sp.]|nr:YcxB family protein [Psychrosphaera sp.]